MVSARRDISNRIADELSECGIGLVASLPDDWVADLIKVGTPEVHLYTLTTGDAVEGVLGMLGDGGLGCAA